MKKHSKYLFHPKLEISQCAEGVLICYILGNKISLFEDSMDSGFSSFILQYKDKPFSVQDMEKFFFEKTKKQNFGNILRKLEKKGLINAIENSEQKSLWLINFTDFSNEKLLNISKEVRLEPHLKLINGLDENKKTNSLHDNLSRLKENQIIFVMSDLKHKYKVSELNLYFSKKGIHWCPIIIDKFGGYIGPLIYSTSSGPCFNCYQEKMYPSQNEEKNKIDSIPVLSDIFLRAAFLEMLKVSTNVSPSQVIYSNLMEIDCFNYRSRTHYIYTNSHCSVCEGL